MTIIGIDPGIATVGFGVIRADGSKYEYVSCGTINTPPGLSLSERLNQIYDDLTELFSCFHPDAVSVEELFFNTNITTGISVAHGRGVILLAARKSGIPIFEYTPLQVKQSVAGYGRADKKQVIAMVQRLLRIPTAPKPDDAADAVALALCHARSATSLLYQLEGEAPCSTT